MTIGELAKTIISLSLEDTTKLIYLMENKFNVKVNFELLPKTNEERYIVVDGFVGSKVVAAKSLRAVKYIALKEAVRILDEAPKLFTKVDNELEAEEVCLKLKANGITARVLEENESLERYM